MSECSLVNTRVASMWLQVAEGKISPVVAGWCLDAPSGHPKVSLGDYNHHMVSDGATWSGVIVRNVLLDLNLSGLDFCASRELAITNTMFKCKVAHTRSLHLIRPCISSEHSIKINAGQNPTKLLKCINLRRGPHFKLRHKIFWFESQSNTFHHDH